jgi:hypothetical protein
MNDSSEIFPGNATDIPNGPEDETASPTLPPDKAKQSHGGHLPERYVIKTNDAERVLICLEAPNISVRVEAGLSFAGSVARKSPNGTIFLDGVAQSEPFMDHERQVYNLDHHEGCVRAFTLATCEQALVMYMKGLDLQSREWNVFANEPDLDTVLAIWILLNHARIGQLGNTQRRILFALVRFEGIIDSLGLELRELNALPPELMRKIQRVIDHLRATEMALKKNNRWIHYDYLAYCVEILHKIDQIFFKAQDFADFQGVHELARIDLTEQRIAVAVEADMGIYEIEPHLNKIYGSRLGIVFLKKGENAYTVRQMDLFMPVTLEEVYDWLNFSDPAVQSRTQAQKWGGAADIGGSPRDSGTALTAREIVQVCRKAVQKPSLLRQAYQFGSTAVLVGMIILCAQFARLAWHPERWIARLDLHSLWANPNLSFITVLLLATTISLLLTAGRRSWQFGWSYPSGMGWWIFLPVSLIAGMAGGVYVPVDTADGAKTATIFGLGIVAMPLATEMLFRSLGHGMLAQTHPIQRHDSRWFLSWPNLASALMYTVYVLIFSVSTMSAGIRYTVLVGILALVFGLSQAMVRERSQSIWPAILFHMIAAASVLLVTKLF